VFEFKEGYKVVDDFTPLSFYFTLILKCLTKNRLVGEEFLTKDEGICSQ